MKPVQINFWIDVSGVPYNTTFVGLIASTPMIIEKAIKRLNKECPRLFSKKAHKLKRDEIFKILSVLNSEKVKMVTTNFPK